MYLAYLFVIALLVCIDQYTKQIVITYLGIGEKLEIIPNLFYINHVRNTGAAWSLFDGQRTLFIIITILAVLGFSYLLFSKKENKLIIKISYLLIIGGAIGNLIDRISYGFVIDFLDFYIFNYDYPVFNVADIFLVIGVILYFISIILENTNAKN